MNKLKSIDQFDLKFELKFDNEKTKKTIPGAILTIVLFSLGFIYFIYLATRWSSGKIQPTVV